MTTAEVQKLVTDVAAKYGVTVANAWKRVFEYTGEDAVEKAERYQTLGQEIEKLWNKTPERVKATIKATVALGGCVALAATVAKTITATAGTSTPAWIKWLASPAGKQAVQNTCGLAVVYATAAASGNDGGGSGSGGDGNSGGSEAEPPLSDAEARRLLDQIERDFQAHKIDANEANEAHNRIRCRQGHWSCRR